LDEEWKASMEAKVDAIITKMTKVDSMAEIKAMLHKMHGHFEVDTYTNPSTIIDEGTPTTMARNGIFSRRWQLFWCHLLTHSQLFKGLKCEPK
jgi:hypothetical protein